MIVKQEKKGFAPITITLQTEEEADALWYALHVDDDKTREDYFEDRDEVKDPDEICDRIEKIFVKYDIVHSVDNH